jgi:DUF2905 family protein
MVENSRTISVGPLGRAGPLHRAASGARKPSVMDLSGLGKLVLVLGLALAGIGLLLWVIGKGFLPHLPGDLSFKVGSVRVFFPLATSIVLSIVLTLLLNLFSRR